MKKEYKKILSIISLAATLALNGCGNSNISKNENKIESEYEDDCQENHLDKNNLKIETLSDESKNLKDASVFYAIRERFLNNNNIINFDNIELDNNYFEILKNNSEYLYLFNNTEVRNHINYFMAISKSIDVIEDNEKRRFYLEDENYVRINLGYLNDNDDKYTFSITSELADYEMLEEEFTTNIINYSKYMHSMKIGNNRLNIIEQYSFSSVEKNDVNKIEIGLMTNYDLHKDKIIKKDYSCETNESIITLNNGEESLKVNLTEQEFNTLATTLTSAAKQQMTIQKFLENNEELMIELFGEEYPRFIEITKSVQYIK